MTIKNALIALGGAGVLGVAGTNTDVLYPNISKKNSSQSLDIENEIWDAYDDILMGSGGDTALMTEEEIANMEIQDLGEGLGIEGEAQFTSIGKADKASAYADGQITVNGRTYAFRSGGSGNGYLPPGEYVVSNGRRRSDVKSMVVDGYGYSFDLSDKHDKRTGKNRTLLRIHPDGGNPGTLGCIGIKGNGATQKQFYEDMKAELDKNGGRIKIKVG